MLLDPLGGHSQAKYRHAKSEELLGIYARTALHSIREPDFPRLLYLWCHESCELFWRVKMEYVSWRRLLCSLHQPSPVNPTALQRAPAMLADRQAHISTVRGTTRAAVKNTTALIPYGGPPRDVGGRTQPQIATMCLKNRLRSPVKETAPKHK